MRTFSKGRTWTAAMFAAMAVSAFAQDEAYVPFTVNVDATIRAAQAGREDVVVTTTNKTATLTLPLGDANSVWYTGGARGRLNAPVITGSRGNITLRLPAQSYRHAEVALHAVNGRRVLRGKAANSETATAISRKNVAAGVYLLSVKGINGEAFTTRLTHSGGSVNINVAFGDGSVSHERRLAKSAAAGDWAITVSAAGYIDHNETITPVKGLNDTVSIILYEFPQPTGETFVDSRDGKSTTYKKVRIGSQTWMAENLNYRIPVSVADTGRCYGNSPDSCAKYGRLYNWTIAMSGASSSSAVPSGVQGVCPVDWHLPSDAEWDTLMVAVGGVKDGDYWWLGAGTKLKSTSGWYNNGNGTDDFGFSALPGGIGYSDGNILNAGNFGLWWSATEGGDEYA